MLGITFISLSNALLLIGLGVGYLVLCLARKEVKLFRKTGYIIGTLVISLSALYIIFNIVTLVVTINNLKRISSQRPTSRRSQPSLVVPDLPLK